VLMLIVLSLFAIARFIGRDRSKRKTTRGRSGRSGSVLSPSPAPAIASSAFTASHHPSGDVSP